ncbi:hypothetical protein C8R43DRAFT_210267 [Mycena crocata]|nr:hypothetical protein C8R43DRAFT_210267 [Mycena crocata]
MFHTLPALSLLFLWVSGCAEAQATTVPQCALGCARSTATKVGCDISASTCLCRTSFVSTVVTCVQTTSCSAAEKTQTSAILDVMCGVASGSASASGQSSPSTSLSITRSLSLSVSESTTVTPPPTSTGATSSSGIIPPPGSPSGSTSSPSSTAPGSNSAPSASPTSAAARQRVGFTGLAGAMIGVGMLVL